MQMHRWGGIAAVLGGGLIAVEIMRLYNDSSQGKLLYLVPPLLMLGSLGLYARGKGRWGVIGGVGAFIALVAFAVSTLGGIGLGSSDHWEEADSTGRHSRSASSPDTPAWLSWVLTLCEGQC